MYSFPVIILVGREPNFVKLNLCESPIPNDRREVRDLIQEVCNRFLTAHVLHASSK